MYGRAPNLPSAVACVTFVLRHLLLWCADPPPPCNPPPNVRPVPPWGHGGGVTK